MQTYAFASAGFSIYGGIVALENQNTSPVTATFIEMEVGPTQVNSGPVRHPAAADA
jgi:hypothetical protein